MYILPNIIPETGKIDPLACTHCGGFGRIPTFEKNGGHKSRSHPCTECDATGLNDPRSIEITKAVHN